ncbi:MAG: DNA cytosine methyltransferase, partial [Acidimicrobiales bacterium]
CESDPHARSVLARHWPDVPCHDDITTLDGKDWRGRVDVVAGGTPCTDLSVAGRRAGLGGEHSRIYWDFCRVADSSAADWILWENVAGALSSGDGEDFAAVLWGITGCRPAVPADGWRSVGLCVGPGRTAVWRLLDAQWFGVAQRRRRVFVVASARAECGLEVLVEPESVPRGTRPGGETGQSVAALTAAGVGTCGADDNQGQAGHLTSGRGQRRLDDQHSLPAGNGGSSRQNGALTPGLAVRRLTPRECERLMSWPDDWTRWAGDGTEIADSHRYRMCGNGVVSNCAEWIGRRIMEAAS